MNREFGVWILRYPGPKDDDTNIISFIVSDKTQEEADRQTTRPNAAEFPVSTLYDVARQRTRASNFADYLNGYTANELTEKGKRHNQRLKEKREREAALKAQEEEERQQNNKMISEKLADDLIKRVASSDKIQEEKKSIFPWGKK